MDILWANGDLTVEAQHLSGTGWKAAEQFEEAGTLLALPVRVAYPVPNQVVGR